MTTRLKRVRGTLFLLMAWALLFGARVDGADPAFAPVQDDPALPRVLLIGDSISIGYTVAVRELLAGRVNVHRVPDNCGPTTKALEHLQAWLGSSRWDVIHFNWGIWDAHIFEDGTHRVSIEQYRRNLEQLVTTLESTGARLIWASTTPVRSITFGSMRIEEADIPAYGAAAKAVMDAHRIPIDDLYNAVLPRVSELRDMDGVHFTVEGSRFLARKVSESILGALAGAPDRNKTESSILGHGITLEAWVVCHLQAPFVVLIPRRRSGFIPFCQTEHSLLPGTPPHDMPRQPRGEQ